MNCRDAPAWSALDVPHTRPAAVRRTWRADCLLSWESDLPVDEDELAKSENAVKHIHHLAVLALFLMTAAAHTEPVAVIPNDVGGEIVLDDKFCHPTSTSDRSRSAYATVPGKTPIFGCWFTDSRTIFVVWQLRRGGDIVLIYDANAVLESAGKRAYPAKPLREYAKAARPLRT